MDEGGTMTLTWEGREEVADWQGAKVMAFVLTVAGVLMMLPMLFMDSGDSVVGIVAVAIGWGVAIFACSIMLLFAVLMIFICRPIDVEKVNGEWRMKGKEWLP